MQCAGVSSSTVIGMSSPSGNLFRREWFPIVEDWPREVTGVVRAWDDAATRDGGDWTVGVLMAMAPAGLFTSSTWSASRAARWTWKNSKLRPRTPTARLTEGRAVILLQQEPGAAGKSYVDAQIREPLSGFAVEVERPTGDKYTRALPMSSAAQAGNIKLVRSKWNKEFIDELEQAGPDERLYDHDDQWDAASSAFNYLASHRQVGGPIMVTRVRSRWDSRFPDDDDDRFQPDREGQLPTVVRIKNRRFARGCW